MYEARDLLAIVLKAGSCDIDFLINKLNELDVEFYDVFEEVKDIGRESDFNSYVYYMFDRAGNTFIDAVKEYVNDFENELCETFGLSEFDKSILENFEVEIYCNYLDSFFNCCLDNYDVADLSEDNIIRFLEELYQLEALAS